MESKDCMSWSWVQSLLRTVGEKVEDGGVSDVGGPEVNAAGGSCCGGLTGGSCIPLKLGRFRVRCH